MDNDPTERALAAFRKALAASLGEQTDAESEAAPPQREQAQNVSDTSAALAGDTAGEAAPAAEDTVPAGPAAGAQDARGNDRAGQRRAPKAVRSGGASKTKKMTISRGRRQPSTAAAAAQAPKADPAKAQASQATHSASRIASAQATSKSRPRERRGSGTTLIALILNCVVLILLIVLAATTGSLRAALDRQTRRLESQAQTLQKLSEDLGVVARFSRIKAGVYADGKETRGILLIVDRDGKIVKTEPVKIAAPR